MAFVVVFKKPAQIVRQLYNLVKCEKCMESAYAVYFFRVVSRGCWCFMGPCSKLITSNRKWNQNTCDPLELKNFVAVITITHITENCVFRSPNNEVAKRTWHSTSILHLHKKLPILCIRALYIVYCTLYDAYDLFSNGGVYLWLWTRNLFCCHFIMCTNSIFSFGQSECVRSCSGFSVKCSNL